MQTLSPDTTFSEALQQRYVRARQHAGPQMPVVLLHIADEQTGIAIGTGATPDVVRVLPLGATRTAHAQFKTEPPTPLAMEVAIMVVEDAVMPLHRLIPSGAVCYSTDTSVREVALLSGMPATDAMLLPLSGMERTFNRLASVVMGTPAAGLPESNAFAAVLLILRECMHHLQFAHMVVLHEK
jgi:exopolyphosphatase/pppGpp-phosphohydrolase